MPVIVDLEKKGEKEVSGGFRLSAKKVNLWVRIYETNFGKRARITVSYFNGERWVNTPPIWLNRELCMELSRKLAEISEKLT